MEFEPIRLEKLPEGQRLAMERELAQSMRENRPPDPFQWGAVPKRPTVPQPGTLGAEDVFTAADLTPALMSRSQEYRVPGTEKRLWVFAPTADDIKAMLACALQPDRLQPDPANPRRAQVARHELEVDLKVAQVIFCCRRGPERSAGRCFGIEHLPAANALLGNSVILEICRISDELGGNEEAMGASARRFFTALLGSLRTLLSASATWEDCPPGLTDTPTRLLSLATRATWRGSVDTGLIDELRELGF